MGLKSGSRDAGLDGSSEEGDGDASEESPPDDPGEAASDRAAGEDERPTMDAIPYKLRRDRVNEGREQVPYFLREDVVAAEDDLQATLEARLGERVYKSDYREAAMVVAQRNPDLVAAVLREWGYDLDRA